MLLQWAPGDCQDKDRKMWQSRAGGQYLATIYIHLAKKTVSYF